MTEVGAAGLTIARFVLEAASPLSAGSGDSGSHDVMLMRDANGLPTILGSSLQGALKALAVREGSRDVLDLLGDRDRASAVAFSSGQIVDDDGASVNGALPDTPNGFLSGFLEEAPLKRDHVKLDSYGAVEGRQKFDRIAVPRGTRFAFELSAWNVNKVAFEALLALLGHPLLRLGGASRRGYGKMNLVKGKAALRCWDDALAKAQEIARLRAKPFSEIAALDGQPFAASRAATNLEVRRYRLKSRHFWRVGQDGARVRTGEADRQDADVREAATFASMREGCVDWTGNRAAWRQPDTAIERDYILPASAVKGALWHRTLFHWNCATGNFVDENPASPVDGISQGYGQMPSPLHALFGNAKDAKLGWRSALIIDDAVFKPAEVKAIDHVMVDRVTQASVASALFSEELVRIGQEGIELNFIVDLASFERRCPDMECRTAALAALDAAFSDLLNGRLPLGAKSSGVFSGERLDQIEGTA